MNIRALRGLNDPLSVDNEAFYTFYRTLKRWTTGTLWGNQVGYLAGGTRGAVAGEPDKASISSAAVWYFLRKLATFTETPLVEKKDCDDIFLATSSQQI